MRVLEQCDTADDLIDPVERQLREAARNRSLKGIRYNIALTVLKLDCCKQAAQIGHAYTGMGILRIRRRAAGAAVAVRRLVLLVLSASAPLACLRRSTAARRHSARATTRRAGASDYMHCTCRIFRSTSPALVRIALSLRRQQ